MPKVSKIQGSFNAGEVSKQVYGEVANPKYEQGLAISKNYLPIIQGPLIRRPGTKFVTYAKNSAQPPSLVPFQFSLTQNYILEFGDKYIRFYQNEGQILTSTTFFSVAGYYGQAGRAAMYRFTALRSSPNPSPGEAITASSIVSSGSILELPSPYNWSDVSAIKFVQKQDTLYLTHPNYPSGKIIRTGTNTWDLKQIFFQDGPYLPLNSYSALGDSANIFLQPNAMGLPTVSTGPSYLITSTAPNGSSAITITTNTNHTFNNGDKVCIIGATGTTEINNVTSTQATLTNSSINQAYWTANNVTANTLDLVGAVYQHGYTGSGFVYPALFQLTPAGNGQNCWADIQTGSSQGVALRNLALIQNGTRYWGNILDVFDAAHCLVELGQGQNLPTTGSSIFWQLGVYNLINGFPGACCFHQDRLVFAGVPGFPQEIDASVTSTYEVFSASGSNLQVNNNNALQFNLNSQELNAILWMKSNSQGLLCGTPTGEWAVTPSTQNTVLTPTSINANQVTAYGSANADAILSGNAALYIQRAQRKVRELLYYWQVGNFRSTNMSELSQHITIPMITKLVNQKEPHATIWGMRSDGILTSLTYSRDDITLTANAGWARHVLGGQSDASGTPPTVKSMAVIPSGDTTFDELWLVTQRYMNGSNVSTIEYMTKPFDDNTPQEQSYHFDCGVTYNSSISIVAILTGSSSTVLSLNHGLTNSSVVRFYNVVGLNITKTDVNGNISSSNVLNEQTFVVTNATTNTFQINDFLGNSINTNSCSPYIGSATVSKLVTTITGLGYLAGETVAILADGGIQPNVTVSGSGGGSIVLQTPASYVQIGYPYNSDGQMLRTHEGSAQGTSIGSTRRVNRVAFMLHNVGDFSFGPSFNRLIPVEFSKSDENNADTMIPLFDGIYRDGIESSYGFDDMICFRQSSGLPGMIQAIVRFFEENDV